MVTIVLKQPNDFPLAKALDKGGICGIFDLLSLSQADHDDLRYVRDDGTEAFLSIGHKGMLKTLKLFTVYNAAEGHPINDWTQAIKKDFDDFWQFFEQGITMVSGQLHHTVVKGFLP